MARLFRPGRLRESHRHCWCQSPSRLLAAAQRAWRGTGASSGWLRAPGGGRREAHLPMDRPLSGGRWGEGEGEGDGEGGRKRERVFGEPATQCSMGIRTVSSTPTNPKSNEHPGKGKAPHVTRDAVMAQLPTVLLADTASPRRPLKPTPGTQGSAALPTGQHLRARHRHGPGPQRTPHVPVTHVWWDASCLGGEACGETNTRLMGACATSKYNYKTSA